MSSAPRLQALAWAGEAPNIALGVGVGVSQYSLLGCAYVALLACLAAHSHAITDPTGSALGAPPLYACSGRSLHVLTRTVDLPACERARAIE